MSASVEVRGLNSSFGPRRILKEVSLDVEDGEILVIMGGSGSGKTTLLNHLLGLLHPSSGSVRILGRDINAIGPAEIQALRTRMGWCSSRGRCGRR